MGPRAETEGAETKYPGVDWGAPSPRWLDLLATAAGLLAGYLVKYQCVVNAWANEFQYRRLCYSDIQALWAIRGIKDGLIPYRDVQMEYPVLTGMFMDLAGRVLRVVAGAGLVGEPSHGSYFVVSALLLAPFGFAVTLFIRPFVPVRRLMVWALGTPIILYGFMNWDLPAVAAATWALSAFLRGRFGWAGVAAAVGASAKLYPAFFLPALLLAAWAKDKRESSLKLAGGFVLAYAALNIPWILVSGGEAGQPTGDSAGIPFRQPGTNGWLGVWLFHAKRGAEFDTVWFWLSQHGPTFSFLRRQNLVSIGTTVLFGVAAALLLWSGWRRRHGPGGLPALHVCLGIVAAFLVTSKIYSPQFGLWLAPLLALLAVPWHQVAAFLIADLGVFVSRFHFYIEDVDVHSGWASAFEFSVWARAAALLAIIWWSSRSERPEPLAPA